jgi:hypothetical protein
MAGSIDRSPFFSRLGGASVYLYTLCPPACSVALSVSFRPAHLWYLRCGRAFFHFFPLPPTTTRQAVACRGRARTSSSPCLLLLLRLNACQFSSTDRPKRFRLSGLVPVRGLCPVRRPPSAAQMACASLQHPFEVLPANYPLLFRWKPNYVVHVFQVGPRDFV